MIPAPFGRLGALRLAPGRGGWWLAAKHRLDGVSPLAILSPASGKSMLGGRVVNDNALISREGGIKYVIGPDGSLQTVPANTLAYDYSNGVRELLLEGPATNGVRNSIGAGVVDGSPGTLPNFWGFYNGGGLTREISHGTDAYGYPYVDIRQYGTMTETGYIQHFESTAAPGCAAVLGETATVSLVISLVAGEFNPTYARLSLSERDSAGAALTTPTGLEIKNLITNKPQRFNFTYTMVNSACAFAHPRVSMSFPANATVDFTLRYSLPQVEKSPVASSPIPTSGVVVTRPTDLAPLWSGAREATAWVWRGLVPSPTPSVGLLHATGGPYIENGTADPTLLRLAGAATQIGDTGVIPGPVGFVVGWGPSGRRLQNTGKAARADSTLITFDRTAMRIGRAAGFSAGHVVRVRELVAWALADRPSVEGVQSQAHLWGA